jgi:hypothetical protein
MDFQNRVGSKIGGGGVASWSETNRQRKERLMKLAMETIDLQKVRWCDGNAVCVCVAVINRRTDRDGQIVCVCVWRLEQRESAWRLELRVWCER